MFRTWVIAEFVSKTQIWNTQNFEKRWGWIKASRGRFGSHFVDIHSNDLMFGYCGSIWLTIKHVKFDRRMWPPSSLTPSCLPPTNSAITQVLNTSMWCMSTCFEPHRASLKMSIVPAFGSFWFENYSIYKKRHMFFGTRVVNASTRDITCNKLGCLLRQLWHMVDST